MKRGERGPLLLIVAGALLLLAIVAYLINDVEGQSRLMVSTAERQELGAQARRTMAEMRALREESDRTRLDRASFRDQQATILESLRRIQERLDGACSPGPGL